MSALMFIETSFIQTMGVQDSTGNWNLHPSIIWDTIQNDLPPLVELLNSLLPTEKS
jgi:uncharacterized protein with HEPN domain